MIDEMLSAGSPALVAAAGLLMGLIHAFEPDHMIAMSTQAAEHRGSGIRRLARLSSIRGALWGAGHTSGIVIVGLAVAGMSLSLGPGLLAGAEMAVGAMLIGLGMLGAAGRGMAGAAHAHPHRHDDGTMHAHPHRHDGGHTHGHRSYLIGCVHGVAGSGGLVAVMALSLGTTGDVVYFMGLFALGSIAGMVATSGVIGLPFAVFSGSVISRYMRIAVACAAMAMGMIIIATVASEPPFWNAFSSLWS